ncbi:SLATT domain-containing protein [Luteococcus sediminum]
MGIFAGQRALPSFTSRHPHEISGLVSAEVIALVLAALRVFGGWDVDLAGLMAAIIAAGGAWVAVKQFSPLAAAYSMAAMELTIQADKLRTIPEHDWPLVAADAEEAISREHTMWLASRTGKRPKI